LERLSEHDVMVRQLFAQCIDKVGDENIVSYTFDHVGLGAQKRPPMIGSSRPDLYGIRLYDGFIVLGEAKTANDLETERSHTQIKNYLEFIEFRESVLFYVVPMSRQNKCRSIMRSINPTCLEIESKVLIMAGGFS